MKILALLLTLTAYPTAWAECISGDCENGTGTFTYPDGETYVGEFVDGKQHGKGTLTWPSGNKYVGEFLDGNIQGKGTLTWPNGDKYFGEFRDGFFYGEGTKTLADGTVKTGFWHHLEYFETKAEWDPLVEKVRLTKEQAQQGDADAQYELGLMYANNISFPYRAIPQDYVAAVKWYTLAAEQRYARAQAALGSMYENSWPYKRAIPQDYVEAVKWYTLAAEQGYAQTTLGYMYVKGYGVEVNYSKADLLFKEDMENEEARSLLNYTPWARLGIYTAENAFGYGLPLAALLILLHIFAKRRGWPAYLRFFTFLLCSGFIGLGLLSYMVLQGWMLNFLLIGFFVLMALYALGKQRWFQAIYMAIGAVMSIYLAMTGYW
jgi:TPR repeat protein